MIALRAAFLAVPLLAWAPALAAAQDFPVTISHAYGETTIESAPARVLTWGWVAHDVVLDLGIVPVGLPWVSYGGGDEGILPWTREALDALGAEMPPRLGEAGGEVSLEAMLALDPDVILAPYSGLTEDEYAALSRIAPVVPFREMRWQGTWRETVEVIGQALGMVEEADALIAQTEALIASAAGTHPEILGRTVINFVNRNDGTISVRNSNDPRTLLLAEAGMIAAAESDTGTTGYTYSVSHENFGTLDVDVMVAFLNTPEAAEAFFALPYIANAPHVRSGRVAVIDSEALTMAVGGAISPLSLRWGFEEMVARIAAAAANVE